MGAGSSAQKRQEVRRLSFDSSEPATQSISTKTVNEPGIGLFLDEQTLEELKQLKKDKAARSTYAVYIKSGLWADKIQSFETDSVPEGYPACDAEANATEEMWKAMGYLLPDNISRRSFRAHASTGTFSFSPYPNLVKKARSYADVNSDMCFSIDDLTSILLVSLFPIYRSSRYYQRWLEYRRQQKTSGARSRTASDEVNAFQEFESCDSSGSCDGYDRSDVLSGLDSIATSPEHGGRSQRLRSILVSVAAYHDQDHLIDMLGTYNLADDFMRALSKCPHAISISAVLPQDATATTAIADTAASIAVGADGSLRAEGAAVPIIYSNDAFRKISGYNSSAPRTGSSKGKPLRISAVADLFGKSTEQIQKERIDYAIETGTATKLAVTCHRRGGTAFKNMIALRPLRKLSADTADVTTSRGLLIPLSINTKFHELQESKQLLSDDYQYVLSIHCDASQKSAKAAALQDIEDLLSLLPFMMRCSSALPQDYRRCCSSSSTSTKSVPSPGVQATADSSADDFAADVLTKEREARISIASTATELI